MAAVARVGVELDARGAINDLRGLDAQTKKTQGALNQLKSAALKLGAAAAALQGLKFVIGKTAELETQTRSLKVLTGSLKDAKKIIKELQQFGAVTPFKSSELIDTAKRLKAFGFETNRIVKVTKQLGDIAGATGAELSGIATAFGQIQAKGRLQGEELLQLQERGVDLQGTLRKEYGLTAQQFQKALSQGQISADAVSFALDKLTEKGGKYADGAVSQSDTLSGKFSTLIDGIERIAQKLGEVLAPALKNVLDLAISAVDNINKAFASQQVTERQKQGFQKQAQDIVQKQAGGIFGPGGPFGMGEVSVNANGKTYKGQPASVVSRITNDLINQEVQRIISQQLGGTSKSPGSGAGQGSSGKPPLGGFEGTGSADRAAIKLAEKNLFISQKRLAAETALGKARNKLNNEYYAAELKINQLAIQRAKQKGETYKVLQLELKQVDLIYKQTVAQIAAEVERARLKVRQVEIATKELEVANLRKKAEDKLQEADKQALALQKEILRITKNNVLVTEQAAKHQIRGAEATAIASKEALKFAYNQEKAEQAANNTANAMGRVANAAARAAKAAQAAGAGGGRNDTFFVNGKEYTYQGSRTSSIVGSGVTIVNKSHNFGNASANSALQDAIVRGSSSQSSGSSQPSSSSGGGGGGGGRYPTRTVHLPSGGSITTVGNMPGTNYIPGGGSVTYAYAEGGYVTRPTNALVGERGESEYVIPSSKMSSAMSRYARGARGESVVEGSGETSAAGRKRSGAVVNISTGPVMQMDGQDYVTVSDLNEAVGNVAAAMSSSDSEGYGGKTRLN